MLPVRIGVLATGLALCCHGFTQELPPTISAAIKKADDSIAKIVAIPDGQRTFENTLLALDGLEDQLNDDTAIFIFMENVSPDSATRDAARAGDEAIQNWSTALSKREDLYKAIQALADAKPQLDPIQQRLLDFTLRDFRRAGMALTADKRKKSEDIEQQINKLGIAFNQSIADDDTTVPFTAAELEGVPQNVLQRQTRSGDLYLTRMDESTYGAISQFAKRADTRHRAWVEYRRRGGPKNVQTLEQIIKLRAEDAQLLGYPTTAAYEMEVRMAKTPEAVQKFYDGLLPLVKKKAAADVSELLALKRSETHDSKAELDPWDFGYYLGVLKKKKYAVDDAKVAEYFPMERVVEGLFTVTQRLYNVEYKDITSDAPQLGLPIWHPDVKLYSVTDKATGQLLGHFYMDLYPRPNKYSHAACWGLIVHRKLPDGSTQLPLAALVANLTRSTADKPSLLPHDEVVTIFHEFGHCLHNIFDQSQYGRFSGTGVELDFVEAPSQMFENWVWQPEVLNLFAKHYKTGQPLPDNIVKGITKARAAGSGVDALGQMFYGEVDQKYHTVPSGVVDTTKVQLDTYSEMMPFKGQPGTFYQASFGHLVGYQAGYYSYLWSLVFAQDMFQRFQKLGILDPKAGAYYREKILSKGGTEDAGVLLHDYLGRDPQMDAFIKLLNGEG